MRVLKSSITFTLFLFALFFNSVILKAQSDLSEGWEINTMKNQPPKRIMDSIGVKPGMVIGEVGAGSGRFTVYLAREVGPNGKIYANDIDKKGLQYLNKRCKKLGFNNVKTIIGKEDNPLFPDNSLDMAIMVWVYHYVKNPDGILKNIKRSLKPGAKLVIIDPIGGESHNGKKQPNDKALTIRDKVEKSAKDCGYKIVKIETFLPEDYIFILKQIN